MAILKVFQKNLTNPEMANYSRDPSPTDAIDELITPNGNRVSVERTRGTNVYDASPEAEEAIIEWTKDSLLARRDNEEFVSKMRQSGQSQEWSPQAFSLSPAETERYRELSDEEKARMQEIIEESFRTDPLNPNAKRMIMSGQAHDNTQIIHWHVLVHAHYIDYKKEPPEISKTVINRRSDKNQTYALLTAALQKEFPWIHPAKSLKETEGDITKPDSEDLNGYDPEDTGRQRAIRMVNASTMALENKLEAIRKRKIEIEEEEQQYITALHYANANDELSTKILELEVTIAAKDEEIGVITAERQKALKDANESEKEAITLNEEIKEKEQLLENASHNLQLAEERVNTELTEKEELKKELEKSQKKIDDYENLAKESDKALAASIKAEELYKTKMEEAVTEKGKIIETNANLQLDITKEQGKNELLKEQVKEQAKELAEANNLIHKEPFRSLLNARLKNAEGDNNAKKKLLDEYVSELAALVNEVDGLLAKDKAKKPAPRNKKTRGGGGGTGTGRI